MKFALNTTIFALVLALNHPSRAGSEEETQPVRTRIRPTSSAENNTLSPTKSSPTYRLHPAYDSAAIILGAMVAGSWFLADEFGAAHCAPLCEKSDVNPIDRFAAGNHDQTWAQISNVTLITSLVSGLLVVGLVEGFPAALTDGLVVAESVILANAAIVLLNVATGRPRPLLYSENAPLKKRQRGYSAMSFPSGHVGATAAMATAVFGLVHLRYPESPWKWVVLGVGTAAVGLVAAGRVLGGRHFLTDVLAGAAIGIGMGILIPALHERNFSVMPVVTSSGFGLGLHRRF